MLKKFLLAFGITTALATFSGIIPPFENKAEAGCTSICSPNGLECEFDFSGAALDCDDSFGFCILINPCFADPNL